MDQKVVKLIHSFVLPYVSIGTELSRDEQAFSVTRAEQQACMGDCGTDSGAE